MSGRHARPLLAMTGEVTLTGKVLPIGGVKEKVLGARRAGIKTILLLEKNRKDLMEDLPEEVRNEIEFHFVDDVRKVLALALEPDAMAALSSNKGSDTTSSGEPSLAPRKTKRTPALPKVTPTTPPQTPPLH